MAFFIKIVDKLQLYLEKVFFKEKASNWSRKLAFIILDLILIVGVFIVLIMEIGYTWTGNLYPEGTGYRLDFIFGDLDDLIPFVPAMAIFYVYLVVVMIIYTFFYFVFISPEKGYPLAWALIFIGVISLIIYIIFPVSTYWCNFLQKKAHIPVITGRN